MLGAPWQRCTVHFLRDMLGHVPKAQQQMVGAAIRQVFAAQSRAEAGGILSDVVDRLAFDPPKGVVFSSAKPTGFARRSQPRRPRATWGRPPTSRVSSPTGS